MGKVKFSKERLETTNGAIGVPIVLIYHPLMKTLDRIMSKNFLSLNVNDPTTQSIIQKLD